MPLALPQYNSVSFTNLHLRISLPALAPQGLIYMKLIKTPGYRTPNGSLHPYPAKQSLFTTQWDQQFVTDFGLTSPSPTQSLCLKPDSELALPTRYKCPASRAQTHYRATAFLNLTISHPTLHICPPPCLKYFEANPSLPLWAKSPFSLLGNSAAEHLACT